MNASETLVPSATRAAPVSKARLWTGRVISGLTVLFLLFDAMGKVMGAEPSVQGTVQLGYPESTVFGIGLTLLVCTILYVVPRTAVLGAILLTGYLGGATATAVRLESPWFLFPVIFGVLVWAGLFLRDERLRTLVPLRKESGRGTGK